MLVFKFGGASIETPERARNLGEIIKGYADQKIVLIVSAKGKTTNALEQIVFTRLAGSTEEALQLVDALKTEHITYARTLLGKEDSVLEEKLEHFITEIEWALTEPDGKVTGYLYDQVVCIGELLSTTIIHAYLQTLLPIAWLDVRGVVKTGEQYREAQVNWTLTQECVNKMVVPMLHKQPMLITQGFIGSSDDNNSTTLGREGSDYTAAIFANMLDAEYVAIWKDVLSLLNADPKIFPNTVPIPEITYHEVIEMAYYGAQVIHPKTIKPLHNKNIPLYVKCFLDPSLPGTKIHNTEQPLRYPPIMVLKQKQILLDVRTKDYSFITEDNLSRIYQLFHQHRVKINLIQNAAISFVACIDPVFDKISTLLSDLEKDYQVKRNEDLFLFTVRHYTQEVLREELKHRTVLLTQKTRQTIQIITK